MAVLLYAIDVTVLCYTPVTFMFFSSLFSGLSYPVFLYVIVCSRDSRLPLYKMAWRLQRCITAALFPRCCGVFLFSLRLC